MFQSALDFRHTFIPQLVPNSKRAFTFQLLPPMIPLFRKRFLTEYAFLDTKENGFSPCHF
jgi:hypothetical protein